MPASGEEGLHGLEVLVAEPGAAVEEEDLDGAAAPALGPHLVFAAADGNHADACGTDA